MSVTRIISPSPPNPQEPTSQREGRKIASAHLSAEGGWRGIRECELPNRKNALGAAIPRNKLREERTRRETTLHSSTTRWRPPRGALVLLAPVLPAHAQLFVALFMRRTYHH